MKTIFRPIIFCFRIQKKLNEIRSSWRFLLNSKIAHSLRALFYVLLAIFTWQNLKFCPDPRFLLGADADLDQNFKVGSNFSTKKTKIYPILLALFDSFLQLFEQVWKRTSTQLHGVNSNRLHNGFYFGQDVDGRRKWIKQRLVKNCLANFQIRIRPLKTLFVPQGHLGNHVQRQFLEISEYIVFEKLLNCDRLLFWRNSGHLRIDVKRFLITRVFVHSANHFSNSVLNGRQHLKPQFHSSSKSKIFCLCFTSTYKMSKYQEWAIVSICQNLLIKGTKAVIQTFFKLLTLKDGLVMVLCLFQRMPRAENTCTFLSLSGSFAIGFS